MEYDNHGEVTYASSIRIIQGYNDPLVCECGTYAQDMMATFDGEELDWICDCYAIHTLAETTLVQPQAHHGPFEQIAASLLF